MFHVPGPQFVLYKMRVSALKGLFWGIKIVSQNKVLKVFIDCGVFWRQGIIQYGCYCYALFSLFGSFTKGFCF